MRTFRTIAGLLLLCSSLMASGQITQITASNIVDGAGKKLAHGQIDLLPTSAAGLPIQPQLGGGGVVLYKAAQCLIVNGAITTAVDGSTCTAADTSLSNQANFCYKGQVKDTSSTPSKLFPVMKCLQPHGTTWSLDTGYVPDAIPTQLMSAGPTGPVGDRGPAGPAGSLTITTQSSLGSASANANVVKVVSDGAAAGSCSAGGGSQYVICMSNGTSWLPVGGATYPGVASDGSNGLAVRGTVAVNKRVPNITVFICDGDSLTYGQNVVTWPANRYCNIATTLSALTGRGITYYNYAGSGNKIADIAAHYVSLVKPKCQAGGALLHLLIGTNNIGAGGQTDAVAFAELQSYVATAQADGCLVSVGTLLPRVVGLFSWTAPMEVYRQAFNSSIRNWAAPDFKVDFDAVVQNSQDLSVFSDGLHPNDSEQPLMANALNAALQGTQQIKPVVYVPPVTVAPSYAHSVNLPAATDLNTVNQCGTYDGSSQVNGPAALGTSYMHVLVLCSSTAAADTTPHLGYTTQIAMPHYNQATNSMYIRHQYASTGATWTAWTAISPVDPQFGRAIALANSTDLNTVVACGIYDGQQLTNGPSALGTAYMHIVVACSDVGVGGYHAQIVTNMMGTTNHMYMRTEVGSSWNAWTEVTPVAGGANTTAALTDWTNTSAAVNYVATCTHITGSTCDAWAAHPATTGAQTRTYGPTSITASSGFQTVFTAPSDGWYAFDVSASITTAATSAGTIQTQMQCPNGSVTINGNSIQAYALHDTSTLRVSCKLASGNAVTAAATFTSTNGSPAADWAVWVTPLP